MEKKLYEIQDVNSSSQAILVNMNGKSKTIQFVDRRGRGTLEFETSETDLQNGLEGSRAFASGKVTLVSAIPVKGRASASLSGRKAPEAAETPDQPEEYAEVTSWQDAKDILRGEPYNVPFQALGNPNAIKAKAAELGVSFPQLIIPE